jgi:hypothetical protein
MKTFSKKFSVTAPKEEKKPSKEAEKATKEELIKYKIMELAEDFLKIRVEGPIDRILMGSIKIEGQALLADAVYEFFKSKKINEDIELLEEAKLKVYEQNVAWFEGKIDTLNEYNSETPTEMTKHEKRIKDLLKKDGKDEIIKYTNLMAAKITAKDKATTRGNVAKKMAKDGKYDSSLLKQMAKIFHTRASEL